MPSTSDLPSHRDRRPQGATLGLFSAALTLLTVFAIGITRPALWADELATEGAARLSLPALSMLVRNIDMVLAPYYILMHAWTTVFGHSELALRAPSVIAMTGAGVLTVDMARRLHGARGAVLALIVFVCVPATSRYGQEARPYAAGCFLVAMAMWCLVVDRNNARVSSSRRYGAAAAVLAAGLMQPAYLLATPGLFAIGYPNDSRARLKWGLLLGTASLPGCLLYLWSAQGDTSIWAWVALVTPTSLAYRLTSVVGSDQAGGAAFLTLAAGGIRARGTHRGLALIGIAPIVVLLLAGTQLHVYVARLLTFTLPALVLLAVATLLALRTPGLVATLSLLAVCNMHAQLDMRRGDGHGQDSRLTQQTIGLLSRPGDVVVYGELPRSINWSPRDMVTFYVPRQSTPPDALALAPQRTDGRFMAPEAPDVSARLSRSERVWVVRADAPTDPRAGLGAKSEWLKDHTRVDRIWRGREITIALMRVDESGPGSRGAGPHPDVRPAR